MTGPRVTDPASILADLFDYVEQYLNASAALQGTENVLAPRMQLRGILVELALKAYLAARGIYDEGHDLIALLDKAELQGLSQERDHRKRDLGFAFGHPERNQACCGQCCAGDETGRCRKTHSPTPVSCLIR